MDAKKVEEFKAAATPLMEWLKANCHPHVTVIVENDSAELVEGLAIIKGNGVFPE